MSDVAERECKGADVAVHFTTQIAQLEEEEEEEEEEYLLLLLLLLLLAHSYGVGVPLAAGGLVITV